MSDIDGFIDGLEKEVQQLPVGDTRDTQLARVQHLKEYRGDDRIVTSEELAETLDNEPPQKKVLSGFAGLDALTGGFTYEQLIVVSAMEKSGKTSFSIQMLEAMREEEPCCFLFEQSPKEIIRQMKSRDQAIPYFVAPASNIDNSMKWIKERSIEAMVKRGSRVFVIDNVDWVEKEYEAKTQRTDEAIKNLLLDLKNFCKEFGIIIFLVAHVRKVPFDQIPQPNDIKDSAAFKQIADTVLILWRKTKEEKIEGIKTKALVRGNETLLWVAENRRTGKVGYVQFTFDGKRFNEHVWDVGMESSQSASDIMAGL